MGIYRAYKGESRPAPVIEVTLSENKPESDSLVGGKVEQLSDSSAGTIHALGRVFKLTRQIQIPLNPLKKGDFE